MLMWVSVPESETPRALSRRGDESARVFHPPRVYSRATVWCWTGFTASDDEGIAP